MPRRGSGWVLLLLLNVILESALDMLMRISPAQAQHGPLGLHTLYPLPGMRVDPGTLQAE